MTGRILLVAALSAAILGVAAAPALASLADEVAAGRQVARQLDAGRVGCSDLDDADFEHLGEYAMERMLGSRATHEALNARMSSTMGAAGTDRMHELMGRRYAGCGASGAGMGGGWGVMMGARDLAWMRNGAWRHMSRADWQRLGATWMGPGMMSGADDGWSTGAVLAVVVGALALGALGIYAVLRRPWRRSAPGA